MDLPLSDRIFNFLQLFLAGFLLGALVTSLFTTAIETQIIGSSISGVLAVTVCRKSWLSR